MSWRKRSRQSCFFLDALWSISFPHSEALIHLGWVVVTVPRKFLYIHIVRRGVNANVPARAHTISLFCYDYGRGYTRKRAHCVPLWIIHGIYSPVPAPYTCSYASFALSFLSFLPSLSLLLFFLRLLSPSLRFLCSFFSWTLRRLFAYAEWSAKKAVENDVLKVVHSWE